MATLRIPPVLRPFVGGSKTVTSEGTTVQGALDDLFERFPDVRAQVLSAEGALSTFVNIYVDDQDVRYLQGLETPLQATSTITLLPAMAGGQEA